MRLWQVGVMHPSAGRSGTGHRDIKDMLREAAISAIGLHGSDKSVFYSYKHHPCRHTRIMTIYVVVTVIVFVTSKRQQQSLS